MYFNIWLYFRQLITPPNSICFQQLYSYQANYWWSIDIVHRFAIKPLPSIILWINYKQHTMRDDPFLSYVISYVSRESLVIIAHFSLSFNSIYALIYPSMSSIIRFKSLSYNQISGDIHFSHSATMMQSHASFSLQWRHNERDGVSNHRRLYCLLNCWFRRRSNKTSKFRVTGLCAGDSPVTGEFPAQKASYAENVSIWWRHHVDHAFRIILIVA